jgi:hypothetical protein
MQGWILMEHRTEKDYTQAYGWLVGSFYSDIESACRAITDNDLRYPVVSVTYRDDGKAVMIVDKKGRIYGAWIMVMPMREDMPTKW